MKKGAPLPGRPPLLRRIGMRSDAQADSGSDVAPLQVDALELAVVGIVHLDQAVGVLAEVQVEAERALDAAVALGTGEGAARGGEPDLGVAELAVDQGLLAERDTDAAANAEIAVLVEAVAAVANADVREFVGDVGTDDGLLAERQVKADLAAIGDVA